ncbi:MAG: GAF domain-containing protein [Gammaproteobacteria bacterium]|nr:GAF domain-containing protein [Gammaproteobacteria bacterium]MBU2287070.1 GAF domain-containing protein [Gammaproteobacteria bacterium]MBU2410435.1 GAF domain-containing protein [Gammaproteobacteria bacterium]
MSLPICSTLSSNLLTVIGEAESADEAFRQLDLFRRVIAGPGVFSVNLNVTTVADPRNEVRLRRLYSSAGGAWPVAGSKCKSHSGWTDMLFVRGEIFVGEGSDALADNFDDHPRMTQHGLRSVVNVPLMKGAQCYATVNVFGRGDRWLPHQVEGVRLLASAAAPWVQPLPDLDYAFERSSA